MSGGLHYGDDIYVIWTSHYILLFLKQYVWVFNKNLLCKLLRCWVCCRNLPNVVGTNRVRAPSFYVSSGLIVFCTSSLGVRLGVRGTDK